MAALGDNAARTAEVAKGAGYKDLGSTSLLRENLMRKDLIYSPRRGLVAFTVPFFAAYVREHHPLAGFDE
jgi:hypothetical protein